MKINNYVWENDLSLNDLVLKQKERIEYLERSNNRREDEILELRKENADLDNIINELENYCWELKAKGCREGALSMLDKLQELKGESK